jgi:RNA polymerase sigma-70 factor, ECF subfamily
VIFSFRSIKSRLSGYSRLSDEELINQFKDSNDPDCLEELFERYTHLLYTVCYKYTRSEDTSKDLVMHIFEKLASDLLVHEIQCFKSWIYKVTRNYCLMELRKKSMEKSHGQKYVEKNHENFVEVAHDDHLVNEEETNELTKHTRWALEQLPMEQQKCLVLFYYEEKSYKEVAEITGFSDGEVKSHIQNGKRKLKILLSRNEKG